MPEAEGIKSFRFSHPEPAGTADVYPVVYKPGQYASFDFQVRRSSHPSPCACRHAFASPGTWEQAAVLQAPSVRYCTACRRSQAFAYFTCSLPWHQRVVSYGQAAWCRLHYPAWWILLYSKQYSKQTIIWHVFSQGLEGAGKVTNRTWTISSHPDETAKTGAFSISVKRVGLASGWLHAQTSPKDITIEWRGAGGEFVPGPGAGPALLIAGGIGGLLLHWNVHMLAGQGDNGKSRPAVQ